MDTGEDEFEYPQDSQSPVDCQYYFGDRSLGIDLLNDLLKHIGKGREIAFTHRRTGQVVRRKALSAHIGASHNRPVDAIEIGFDGFFLRFYVAYYSRDLVVFDSHAGYDLWEVTAVSFVKPMFDELIHARVTQYRLEDKQAAATREREKQQRTQEARRIYNDRRTLLSYQYPPDVSSLSLTPDDENDGSGGTQVLQSAGTQPLQSQNTQPLEEDDIMAAAAHRYPLRNRARPAIMEMEEEDNEFPAPPPLPSHRRPSTRSSKGRS